MKVKILQVLKDGASKEKVMRQFYVKKSRLPTFIKNEAEIIEPFDSEKFYSGRKRLSTTTHSHLEEALLRWIAAARDTRLPLRGPLI